MTVSPAELGHRLQLAHGTLWLHRVKGDPYAALLCDLDNDPRPLHEGVRARGPLWRSELGTWVTADPWLGARLLEHPGLEHVLPIAEAAHTSAVVPPDLERVCARVLDTTGEDFDLVTEVADPIMVGVLAELCGVEAAQHDRLAKRISATAAAQDAVLCPQRLADTRRMLVALDDLRDLFGSAAMELTLAVVGARTGADLIVNTVLRAQRSFGSGLAEALVEQTLREDPPVRLACLKSRTDLEIGGAEVSRDERITILLDAAGGLPPKTPHQVLVPFYLATAEAALGALAARYSALWSAGPLVRRPRAPVTRGLARVPIRATRRR